MTETRVGQKRFNRKDERERCKPNIHSERCKSSWTIRYQTTLTIRGRNKSWLKGVRKDEKRDLYQIYITKAVNPAQYLGIVNSYSLYI